MKLIQQKPIHPKHKLAFALEMIGDFSMQNNSVLNIHEDLSTKSTQPISAKAKLIAAARECIGTPFRLHGREKNVALDCAGLILHLAKTLDIKTLNGVPLHYFDRKDYSLRQQSNTIGALLMHQFHQSHRYCTGDLLLMNFDSNPNHLAIMSHFSDNTQSIIHASISAGSVIEQRLDAQLLGKISAGFIMI